jgi:methylenetetrahydrofolate reductase (NADPH)
MDMRPDAMIAGSRLERTLRAGHFAVTAELHPPDSADPADVIKAAQDLAEYCDAINATDASGAHCHMSSVAICSILEQAGLDPVLQVSCRDRNRIAMQGDVLGAAALGVRNVLCLTGDDVTAGDQPQTKRVFDFDSIHLLQTLKIMRDQSMFLSGRRLTTPPNLFLGAASNPFVQPYDWRPVRLAKKIEAGANFIQTQYCYNIPRLKTFMARVRDMGLHERAYILVGVGPLRGVKAANFMRNNVPGVHIPEEIIERLRGAEKGKQKIEGKKICIELIQQIQDIEGIHGVHIMAFNLESMVGEIIAEAGLLPRPKLDAPVLSKSAGE